MTHRLSLLFLFLALAAVVLAAFFPGAAGQAHGLAAVETPEPSPTPGPNRKTSLVVPFTRYTWWINRWSDNDVLCGLVIDHEGLPTGGEILGQCGSAVHQQWQNTPPCAQDPAQCPGVYLSLIASQPDRREVHLDLPPPEIWLSVADCNPVPPANRCATLPSLRLEGTEPLPGESIIAIQGYLNGKPFSCPGSACDLPLPATGLQGMAMEFWAESSFGDSTEHALAIVRLMPWGDFAAPEGERPDAGEWYIDVISERWRGDPLPSCAQTWEALPEVGGPPGWLQSPSDPAVLQSDEPYYYLAGSLIQNDKVDAAVCPNGGLEAPGVANACGLEQARPAVNAWQDQFDASIIQVAQETGIPAQLMKNVFSRESQFWPGVFQTLHEAGLGQLTENGADTVLLWNPDFYRQFCPLVFDQTACGKNYTDLAEEEQAILKGALVSQVIAACPDCPAGVDEAQAGFSVRVFAAALRASCEQAGQIVYNTAGAAAGQAASYTDLWRFTLVNYNAGPGCLSEAIDETAAAGLPFTWEHVSARLDEACQGAVEYVEDISRVSPAVAPTLPIPAGTRQALPTPLPGTPVATATQAGGTPQPTATSAAYPPAPGSPTPNGTPSGQPTPTQPGSYPPP